MSKKLLNPHRVVKIDYSVLKEFLDYFEQYDGVIKTDYYNSTYSCPFPERLKKKAKKHYKK